MLNLTSNCSLKTCVFIVALATTACCHTQQQTAKRNPQARKQFLAHNPCPSTGKAYGACPGYVVDHIVPIKRGGGDNPYNMQWQTVQEGKEKDRWE